MTNGSHDFGPNVQAFVDAGMLPPEAANALTDDQRAVINSWPATIVQQLIELYQQTGAIPGAQWI